ncbi:MAG TPA: hypothetical protein VL979_03810 [Solirubrobacteraceae bacterium]|nr:hypothetical protein [Solirubrobacteraceae bacterium]
MSRVLIVAGGCRGRRLAAGLIADGHAVRITTRGERGRAAIEALGAECWVGTPDRLATLRGALEGVTIACWLLGTAAGPAAELEALHGPRLRLFVTQTIDTAVRGLVYEARGAAGAQALIAGGERAVRELAERNAIPVAFLTADPCGARGWGGSDEPAGAGQSERWLADARGAVGRLLSRA